MIVKTFKIFESFSNLSEDLNEFLLYFQDEDYVIENRIRYGGGILIINNYGKKERYKFINIKDYFLRLIEFLFLHLNKIYIEVSIFNEFDGYQTLNFKLNLEENINWEKDLSRINDSSIIKYISIEI